jgi:glyoxylate/hydroxypyruvate reductase
VAILLCADVDAAELALWLRCLRDAMPQETLVTDRSTLDASAIDVAIVAKPPAGSLHGLPRLRLVQSLWAGVDRLLQDPTIPADVPLARMVDPAMNTAMAQTALWAVLGLHRRFFDYAQLQHAGQWVQHSQLRADEIEVAVLGLGQMGQAVLEALAAQGYRTGGWSRAMGPGGLPPLLAGADVVVNLLPLTESTASFFDKTRFAQMKRGAALVNLARGGHVVEGALIDALDSGQLSRAVLDVFRTEPLPSGHAFWTHPRVTVLPHIAAWTDARSASAVVAKNVAALRSGAPIEHLVDRGRGY